MHYKNIFLLLSWLFITACGVEKPSDFKTTTNSKEMIWPSKVYYQEYRPIRVRYMGQKKDLTWVVYEKLQDGTLRNAETLAKITDDTNELSPVFFDNPIKNEMIFQAPRAIWKEVKSNLLRPVGILSPDIVGFILSLKDTKGNEVAKSEIVVQPFIPFLLPPGTTQFSNQYALGIHVLIPSKFFTPQLSKLYSDGIFAAEAWNVQNNCDNVLIAVLDSGIDTDHPQMKGSIAASAVDPSGRVGINLIDLNQSAEDDLGHGTHVSGIIGADLKQNGICGVCWNANIIPIRYVDKTHFATIEKLYEGLKAALNSNVKIVNLSSSTSDYFPSFIEDDNKYNASKYLLESIVDQLANNNQLIIISAGNDDVNLDVFPSMLSSLSKKPNVILVGATDRNQKKASFSNQGIQSVHVLAPGATILSTYPPNLNNNIMYKELSGTSMAAPYVSGLAALLWARYPSLKASEIKERIILTSTYDQQLDSFSQGGIINAFRALTSEFDDADQSN
jgi:subtilisin family serine protease